MITMRQLLIGSAATIAAIATSGVAMADGYNDPPTRVRVERVRRVVRRRRPQRTVRRREPTHRLIDARSHAREEHPWSPQAIPTTRVAPSFVDGGLDDTSEILSRGTRFSSPVQYHLMPTTGGRYGAAR
jgi:hypothetical protein